MLAHSLWPFLHHENGEQDLDPRPSDCKASFLLKWFTALLSWLEGARSWCSLPVAGPREPEGGAAPAWSNLGLLSGRR